MNFRRRGRLPRQMFPDLIRSEHQNRSQQPHQRAGDAVDRCLSRPPSTTPGRKRVKPVLENIEIKGAQVYNAEVIQRVINTMKVEAFIEFQTLGYQMTGPSQHPAVQFLK